MMQVVKVTVFFLLFTCLGALTGCVSEQQYQDLKVKNDTQAKRIADLSSELSAIRLERDKLQRQLDYATSHGGVEVETLRNQVNALEADLERKKALIARMQGQLLGGVQLPVELSTMLEDFASKHEMVTYDPGSGVVKFKSDLLFNAGSDVVASDAAEAVTALCSILNSEQGKEFDVIIAGHTDDIPIGRPETRKKHPTNWHLSAHRAISVLKVMTGAQVEPKRMSARGFGEYRPVAANRPNKKGNPQNRRVEIYIVPQGM
jgi:chemotaxis protein MotB